MKNGTAPLTLRIEQLSKTYRKGRGDAVEALKSFSLELQAGEIFGLLGPNGAGKTTLVKTLLGIVRPTSGRAFILDHPVGSVKARQHIGYLPENHRFPGHLSGEQLMRIFGELSGVSGKKLDARIDELLELVELREWRATAIRKYSKGMQQRLGLAQALISKPQLLFLDEPTDGIDPVGRKRIRDVLIHARDQGTTIFLNSHLLSEVELLTDRVAILNKGTVVAAGTTEELTATPNVYTLEFDPAQADAINGLEGVKHMDSSSGTLELLAESVGVLNQRIDTLRQHQVLLKAVRPKRNTLEQLFFDVIEQQ